MNFTYRWSFEHGFQPDPWYDADCLRTKGSKCSAWKLPVVGWFSKAMSTCVSDLILASARGNGTQHTWKSGPGSSCVFTNTTLSSCNDSMWDVQIHLSTRSGKFSRCIFIRLAQLSWAVSLVTIIWYQFISHPLSHLFHWSDLLKPQTMSLKLSEGNRNLCVYPPWQINPGLASLMRYRNKNYSSCHLAGFSYCLGSLQR